MGDQANPFALVKASDYTDAQINSLWVELGPKVINALIEPRSPLSKYILGGKGSGKTHILRHNSYQVARLRSSKATGLDVVRRLKFLAVFLRAAALDAARFELFADSKAKWQQVFSVYFELRLAEALLEAVCDIKTTSPNEQFDDESFLRSVREVVIDESVDQCRTVQQFSDWITSERRRIDDATNNAAFSGVVSIRIPFSIGALCFGLTGALRNWSEAFEDIPVIYLIDEVENLSDDQQQVINTLLRYAEGRVSFRITGRLYARKTLATIGSGEENREGSEFVTVYLDDILNSYPHYGEFAKRFILKRLGYAGTTSGEAVREPSLYFDSIRSDGFYEHAREQLNLDGLDEEYAKRFEAALRTGLTQSTKDDVNRAVGIPEIYPILVSQLPPIIGRLNVLLFCKKFSRKSSLLDLARQIRSDSIAFVREGVRKGAYANAYGHFAGDLFAQMCRESKLGGVPYAGFENFVKMSSGNPRNLLVILGRAFEIASFRELDFINGSPLSIRLQTEAALEAARFMYERDTNYGGLSDLARMAAGRLAEVLRTARYALKIPEVSPLAVSFADTDLLPQSRRALDAALNYSFLFEIREGRPDRNSDRLMRKVQLNPLLAPRWGLPISRRGDLPLGSDILNAVFDSDLKREFDVLLKALYRRWNQPFSSNPPDESQGKLFQ